MRYVAFFRGINVGGRNAVRMDDLRRMFLDLGLHDPVTYIQSGNVIFGSALDENPRDAISAMFEERFGFGSGVTLRSEEELDAILDGIPFTDAEMEDAGNGPDVEHLYVFMSDGTVTPISLEDDDDRIRTDGRETYLLCRNGMGRSKAAGRLSKDATMTARSIRTIRRIREIMHGHPESGHEGR